MRQYVLSLKNDIPRAVKSKKHKICSELLGFANLIGLEANTSWMTCYIEKITTIHIDALYTRYPIVGALGRVRARTKVSCIQIDATIIEDTLNLLLIHLCTLKIGNMPRNIFCIISAHKSINYNSEYRRSLLYKIIFVESLYLINIYSTDITLYSITFVLCLHLEHISNLELSKFLSLHFMIDIFSVKHNWLHFCPYIYAFYNFQIFHDTFGSMSSIFSSQFF